jgi:large subunit ribosomal protein L21
LLGGLSMYAVVDIMGFQYKLEKGEKIRVPKCNEEVGNKMTFPKVLLVSDGDTGEDKMEKGVKREGLSPTQIADKYIERNKKIIFWNKG